MCVAAPRKVALCLAADWQAAELQEIYALQRTLTATTASEPQGVRASVLAPDDALRSQFSDWSTPFRAGQLFPQDPQNWDRVFHAAGEEVPSKLRRWLTEGYSTHLDKEEFGRQPGHNKLSEEEEAFITKTIETDWLSMGCVEEVSEAQVHYKAVICNLLVAYRGDVMERVCWSGKAVNKGVEDKAFKMEQLDDIMKMAEPGDVAFSLDFEKGFYQFGLSEKMSRLLYFRHKGTIYRWKVLPMGLKSAPRDFSWVVKRVLLLFRKVGIRCAFFIDDLIFLAKSRAELLQIRQFVLATLYKLGMRVSLKKSLLVGGELIKHLGMDLDFTTCSVFFPEQKIMKLKELASAILEHHTAGISARLVAKFVGKLISAKLACPIAIVASKGLSRAIAALPKWQTNKGDWTEDFDAKVYLSPLAVAELRLWCACLFHTRSCSRERRVVPLFLPTHSASGNSGSFGETCDRVDTLGLSVDQVCLHKWPVHIQTANSSTIFQKLLQVIVDRKDEWKGALLHCVTDDAGVAFTLPKGSMKNFELHTHTLAVWTLCAKYNILLSVQFLARDGIVQTTQSCQSGLSMNKDPYNCTMRPAIFKRLWEWKGPFDVDVFAAPGAVMANPVTGAKLDCVSPFPMKSRLHCDALSFVTDKLIYAFPPPGLIPKYLRLIKTCRLSCVVIVPEWKTSLWWPLVENRERCCLGPVKACIQTGKAGLAHPFGKGFDKALALLTNLWAVAFNM